MCSLTSWPLHFNPEVTYQSRKELRQVKTSSGTMAQSVITLLNLASRTLRVSTTSPGARVEVMFSWSLSAMTGSLSRLVKYWQGQRRQRQRERERSEIQCFPKDFMRLLNYFNSKMNWISTDERIKNNDENEWDLNCMHMINIYSHNLNYGWPPLSNSQCMANIRVENHWANR